MHDCRALTPRLSAQWSCGRGLGLKIPMNRVKLLEDSGLEQDFFERVTLQVGVLPLRGAILVWHGFGLNLSVQSPPFMELQLRGVFLYSLSILRVRLLGVWTGFA